MFFQRKRTIWRARCYLKLRETTNNWETTLLHSSRKLLHRGQRINKAQHAGETPLALVVLWIKNPEGVKWRKGENKYFSDMVTLQTWSVWPVERQHYEKVDSGIASNTIKITVLQVKYRIFSLMIHTYSLPFTQYFCLLKACAGLHDTTLGSDNSCFSPYIAKTWHVYAYRFISMLKIILWSWEWANLQYWKSCFLAGKYN